MNEIGRIAATFDIIEVCRKTTGYKMCKMRLMTYDISGTTTF